MPDSTAPGDGHFSDPDLERMWSHPEYHGDYRSPEQRRNDAIERQEEKYRRAQAWRDGKLDEYDAIHWRKSDRL